MWQNFGYLVEFEPVSVTYYTTRSPSQKLQTVIMIEQEDYVRARPVEPKCPIYIFAKI